MAVETQSKADLAARAQAERAKSGRAFLPRDFSDCNQKLEAFFDGLAPKRDAWCEFNAFYHDLLLRQYRFTVPENTRVMEIGCGTGRLLAGLKPSFGLGLDLSSNMIEGARERHQDQPNLRFESGAVETFTWDGEPFDYIVMSDLLAYLYDIKAAFECVKPWCHARTRLVMNFHSRLWSPLLGLAEILRLKARQPVINWVTPEDVDGMLRLAGFETVKAYPKLMLPVRIPLLTGFCNHFLAPFWPFRHLCLTHLLVARPARKPFEEREPSVSVVVACRNEAGNIPSIVARVPKMGSHTELIFVEGNSKDDTFAACELARDEHPELDIKVYRQDGKGKGDAVRKGFTHANGEILMILDADMTVPPEDLPHFYHALTSGAVEFVNGSRLVYAMEGQAMRFLNLCGNKFFALTFSFLLEQRIKDTLCGTKVLLKSDYERIAANRAYFGDFDPFGDFDLLFGAAKLGLKIQDLPIRYRDRTYGETNISRFKHGWMLLRMSALAFWRLKCY
jgi:SAM-dependent methyltransferase